jgi:hypothetical protein
MCDALACTLCVASFFQTVAWVMALHSSSVGCRRDSQHGSILSLKSATAKLVKTLVFYAYIEND